MPLFTSLRSTDPSPQRRNRSSQEPALLACPADATPSLPRHVLVDIARISADVVALRARFADTPRTQVDLATILGRLDDLVDSIYRHATDLPATGEVRDRP